MREKTPNTHTRTHACARARAHTYKKIAGVSTGITLKSVLRAFVSRKKKKKKSKKHPTL